MVREAFKSLINAEKLCIIEGYAVNIFHDNKYYLIYNPDIYNKYVIKYKKECITCE